MIESVLGGRTALTPLNKYLRTAPVCQTLCLGWGNDTPGAAGTDSKQRNNNDLP